MVWAILSPDGTEIRLVTTGREGGPEEWEQDRLDRLVEVRKASLQLVEQFAWTVAWADPARKKATQEFWDERDRERKARQSERQIGEATLKLDEGEAYEVDGAVVIGPDGEIVERGVHARWLDAAGSMFGLPPQARELPEERRVWARPLANGLWRRGRLRVEADQVVFIDERSATNGLRGSGERAELTPERSLERDIKASEVVRAKAVASLTYAELLYRALENSTWRHLDGTECVFGMRSTGEIVASLVGSGDYLSFYMSGPSGVLDEEVIQDLRALGWERIPQGDR